MKNLLLLLLAAGSACHHPALAADPVKVAGKWQLALTGPHGTLGGTIDLKQDGVKVSGSWETDGMGAIPIAGTLHGSKVALTVELHGVTAKLDGTVQGAKMTGTIEPGHGTWTATRQGTAATAPARSILGSIAAMDAGPLQFTVKPDSGALQRFRVGAETQVVQVAPGEQDLGRAKPAKLTDIMIGDRVLVSFVEGLAEARRIVLVAADDIAKRNEAEKLDWQKRGLSGIVASKTAEEVMLETRTMQGVQKTTVVITGKTKIRRYAPDSVSFAAAVPSKLDAIAAGDQFRVRGNRSADGARLVAEEVVFGTFLTKVGTIVSVDVAARQVRVQDLITKAPLTVKIGAESQIKTMSAARPGPAAGGGHAAPATAFDLVKMLQGMPAAKIDELKAGSAVAVTATRGSRADEVTAIMLLANIDGLIQAAQAQAARDGGSVMDAMAGLHGGIMQGPTGLSLPAILQ
jgi:hypothetical protein